MRKGRKEKGDKKRETRKGTGDAIRETRDREKEKGERVGEG